MSFEKGKSGNPSGRPRGIGIQGQFRAQIVEIMPLLIERLKDAALGGDVMAAKLLIDKVLINARPEPEKLTKGFKRGDLTPADTAKHILESTMNGLMTVEQCQAVMGALANYCKIVETDELTRRIDALEQTNNNSQ